MLKVFTANFHQRKRAVTNKIVREYILIEASEFKDIFNWFNLEIKWLIPHWSLPSVVYCCCFTHLPIHFYLNKGIHMPHKFRVSKQSSSHYEYFQNSCFVAFFILAFVFAFLIISPLGILFFHFFDDCTATFIPIFTSTYKSNINKQYSLYMISLPFPSILLWAELTACVYYFPNLLVNAAFESSELALSRVIYDLSADWAATPPAPPPSSVTIFFASNW